MYKMYDTKDRGDSGAMSMALIPDATGITHEHDARPRVGVAMCVGALRSTMFGADTWWRTTVIKEILEDTPDKVVFKTISGSEYTWEVE